MDCVAAPWPHPASSFFFVLFASSCVRVASYCSMKLHRGFCLILVCHDAAVWFWVSSPRLLCCFSFPKRQYAQHSTYTVVHRRELWIHEAVKGGFALSFIILAWLTTATYWVGGAWPGRQWRRTPSFLHCVFFSFFLTVSPVQTCRKVSKLRCSHLGAFLFSFLCLGRAKANRKRAEQKNFFSCHALGSFDWSDGGLIRI